MSITPKKSFIINNNMARVTRSHVIQLFKPSYNPKLDDDLYVASLGLGGTPANNFSLQYYPKDNATANANAANTVYNTKNIVSGLFLATENFITFINKINFIWYNDVLPRVITPVNYTQDPATGNWTSTSDSTFTNTIITAFNGPSSNNCSAAMSKWEAAAARGIESDAGNTMVLSQSLHEIFLRHLYSTDSGKRDMAFNFAQSFYGLTASEVAAAKLEFIPAENFDSDKFNITLTDNIAKFDYPTPIKFINKYDETIHNISNATLYLYFPFITSNSMRANNDTNYDYRNLIQPPIRLKSSQYNSSNNYWSMGGTYTPTNNYEPPYYYRSKNSSNGAPTALIKNQPTSGPFLENAPTLTNSLWAVQRNKSVNQAGYTALKITEVGGGGDLQFDHIDKIDYIDSLTIEIALPTVFS